MAASIIPFVYLVSVVLFIYGLKLLSKVRTARRGNHLAATAMLLAVVGTLMEIQLLSPEAVDYRWIIGGLLVGGLIGAVAAVRVAMTSMPEMVALFNGFGGGASALVASAVVWSRLIEPGNVVGTAAANLEGGGPDTVTISLSIVIGGVTFSGSLIALMKLQGVLRRGAPILLPGRHLINAMLVVGIVALSGWFGFGAEAAADQATAVLLLAGASLLLGVLVVIPIGGADMPVVVSLLNSYSGLAACAAGFVIGSNLLIIAGSMVGAAGLILTRIMCVAMNRSLLNVLLGGFGVSEGSQPGSDEYVGVKACGAEEAAMLLETAASVVIVPGYGLAVAQAQHAVRELADVLQARGATVTYGIHPVAGRMPGHMNILLAEADVPYEQLLEMDTVNADFRNTDVTLVLGANDVVNPAATDDTGSPIYGMPILNVHESRTVFVVKRSLSPGYAGIKNALFERENAMMLFGDAKQIVQALISEVKQL